MSADELKISHIKLSHIKIYDIKLSGKLLRELFRFTKHITAKKFYTFDFLYYDLDQILNILSFNHNITLLYRGHILFQRRSMTLFSFSEDLRK